MSAEPLRAPSFKGYKPASSASSYAKTKNPSSGTEHERLLRSLLWQRGLRFRKNVRTLPGKPDIVFPASHIAVFCDGDFWHGRDWGRLSRKLQGGTNASYWIPKIKANRNRDRLNTRLLQKDGWMVMRLWETDIRRSAEDAALAVEQAVRRRLNAIH